MLEVRFVGLNSVGRAAAGRLGRKSGTVPSSSIPIATEMRRKGHSGAAPMALRGTPSRRTNTRGDLGIEVVPGTFAQLRAVLRSLRAWGLVVLVGGDVTERKMRCLPYQKQAKLA